MNGRQGDDDADFMRRHFPDTRPLRQSKQTPGRRKPLPHKRIHQASDLSPQFPGRERENGYRSENVLSYAGEGIQKRLMLQLRRGTLPVEGRLDLHGLTVDQAYREVMHFLERSRNAGHRCVLIIHGKGARSPGSVPVLKQNVSSWLRVSDLVLAFHSARHRDGGTGAVYVLLRR